MRKLIIILLVLSNVYTYSQQSNVYYGIWQGEIAGVLTMDVEIKDDDNGKLAAYISTVSQGVIDLKADSVSINDNQLYFAVNKFGASYKGIFTKDTIKGVFSQGADIEVIFNRVSEKYVQLRPQTPSEPFSYDVESFSFKNEEQDITLSGTLTLPKGDGPFPAAILVSGSGPSDRNQEILGHKIFMVVADYLTKRGIAVLRYDDRGVGKSEGVHSRATSMDLAHDAASAYRSLIEHSKVRESEVGIIGHSEGGLIAPIVADQVNDLAFIVLLAGPGVPIVDLMIEQISQHLADKGVVEPYLEENKSYVRKLYSVINSSKPMEEHYDTILPMIHNYYESLPSEYKSLFGTTKETYYLSLVSSLSSDWMRYFLAFDPSPFLEKVYCPILAINGDKDQQVVASQNLPAIEKIFQQNKNNDYTIKYFKDHNHLFQHCVTGSTSEYGKIEETFSEEVLDYIANWIRVRFL